MADRAAAGVGVCVLADEQLTEPKFYIDVAIDDLWELAKTMPPESANYQKVVYVLAWMIRMYRNATGTDGMQFYLDDLSKYELGRGHES